MRDLRVRFGVVLGLAMLPLLTFSIWQSYYDYKRDNNARDAALLLLARQSATQIVATVETATSVLKTVDQTLKSEDDCSAVLTDIASNFPEIEHLYLANPQGQYICSTDDIVQRTRTFQFVNRLSIEEPVALLKRDVMSADQDSTSVIRVAFGSYAGETLKRVIIVDLAAHVLKATDIPRREVSEGIRLSIINFRGEVLIGSDMNNAAMSDGWRNTAKSNGQFAEHYKDSSGVIRDLKVLSTTSPNVYIAYSRPHQNVFSWNIVNPLSSAIVPIIAWIFGFVAIWLATERLILTHLRRMRTSVVRFTRGNMDERIGELKNPPASIRELGRTLDLMAGKISTREEDLADALNEKEMLLREVHHRVKNNLQIIISLLNMQERKLTDTQGLAAIKDTRSRINAIALVHRGLYESSDLRYIPMNEFLTRLIGELGIALGTERLGISLTSDTDCSPLEADTAIPVSLFIVEAITNSVKHGVDNGGTVHVRLQQTDNNITVSVMDSGKGFDPAALSNGTGTKLIKGFARQLSAELTYTTSDTGHEVKMTFTHRPYFNDI